MIARRMSRRVLPLSRVYALLEPGPVVLITTSIGGRPNVIAQCYANLECRVIDARLAVRYNLFILQVLEAWITPTKKRPRTLHHLGRGSFMVAGKTIRLASRMR